jgi:hypothetical protein
MYPFQMMGLRAAVFAQEQKLLNRGKRTVSELRQEKARPRDEESVIRKDKNKGVEARMKRDADADNDDDEGKSSRVQAALTAKALLYEKMKAGELTSKNSSLVDFSKRKATSGPDPPATATAVSSAASPAPAAPSKPSGEDAARERSDVLAPASASAEARRSVYGPASNWQWSRGSVAESGTADPSDEAVDEADWKRRKLEEREFKEQVQASVAGEVAAQSAEAIAERRLSAASRVKSQWEKTLSGAARDILEKIHEETELGRSMKLLEREGGESAPSSGGNGAALNPREQRLELIRRKQEERRRMIEAQNNSEK